MLYERDLEVGGEGRDLPGGGLILFQWEGGTHRGVACLVAGWVFFSAQDCVNL